MYFSNRNLDVVKVLIMNITKYPNLCPRKIIGRKDLYLHSDNGMCKKGRERGPYLSLLLVIQGKLECHVKEKSRRNSGEVRRNLEGKKHKNNPCFFFPISKCIIQYLQSN